MSDVVDQLNELLGRDVTARWSRAPSDTLRAAASEIAALRAEIEALRERVVDLETRMAAEIQIAREDGWNQRVIGDAIAKEKRCDADLTGGS